jgi:hypothetical protein
VDGLAGVVPQYRLPLLFLVLVLALASATGGQLQAQAAAPTTLYPGWNLLLYVGIALPTEQALNEAAPAVESVWAFEAQTQTWTVWSRELPDPFISLAQLEPVGIYFVRALSGAQWTHPLVAPPEPEPEPEPDPDPAPTGTGAWQVVFERTTVLFAFDESLTIAESGAMTVNRNGVESQATLDAANSSGLDALFETNTFFLAWPTDTTSGCESCFRYTITVTAPGGQSTTLESDGVGASGALLDAINRLTAFLLSA